MSEKGFGPIAQAWLRWKALRLPWRKRFLVGYDLQGNTYWEFRLSRDETRWRRIVRYPRSTHYSQVQVSPLWHQWLRYTREDPPNINEQRANVVRQAQMKQLAAQADARWEAKPKVMDIPNDVSEAGARRAIPASGGTTTTGGDAQPSTAPDGNTTTTGNGSRRREVGTNDDTDGARRARTGTSDPWANARAGGAGERWQPEAWKPRSTDKR